MKAFISTILLFCGAVGLLVSVCYTAMLWPMSAFGGDLSELRSGELSMAASVVLLVIGFLIRKGRASRQSASGRLSPELQAKEAELKRRANEGKR